MAETQLVKKFNGYLDNLLNHLSQESPLNFCWFKRNSRKQKAPYVVKRVSRRLIELNMESLGTFFIIGSTRT